VYIDFRFSIFLPTFWPPFALVLHIFESSRRPRFGRCLCGSSRQAIFYSFPTFLVWVLVRVVTVLMLGMLNGVVGFLLVGRWFDG